MASLAAMVWFTVTGTVIMPKGSTKVGQGKQSPRLANAGGSEQGMPLQNINKALRQGKLSDAIALLQQLPETLAGHVPASVAPRLLTTVAKATDFDAALA